MQFICLSLILYISYLYNLDYLLPLAYKFSCNFIMLVCNPSSEEDKWKTESRSSPPETSIWGHPLNHMGFFCIPPLSQGYHADLTFFTYCTIPDNIYQFPDIQELSYSSTISTIQYIFSSQTL